MTDRDINTTSAWLSVLLTVLFVTLALLMGGCNGQFDLDGPSPTEPPPNIGGVTLTANTDFGLLRLTEADGGKVDNALVTSVENRLFDLWTTVNDSGGLSFNDVLILSSLLNGWTARIVADTSGVQVRDDEAHVMWATGAADIRNETAELACDAVTSVCELLGL